VVAGIGLRARDVGQAGLTGAWMGRPVRTDDRARSARGSGPPRAAWSASSSTRVES